MHLGVLFAFTIVLAAPAPLAGETETEVETVELAYHVPDGCPDESTFVSAVTARTRRAKFVGGKSPGARRFVVTVRHIKGKYSGSLVVDRKGERATREVTSARCEDLVEALVFFTAIAIDPAASLAPPEPEPGAAPPPAPDASPEPEPPPSLPPKPHVPRVLPSKPPPPVRPSWHLSAGSGGLVATGIAASAMAAAYPVVDLASSGTGFSPSARLGFVWANGASQLTRASALTLRLRTLALSGCAYHVRLGGMGAVRVCALLEGGVLEVRPFGLAHPASPNRPWFAAGPLVRLDLPILPKRLAIGADAAVAIPTEREHAYVDQGPTVALVSRFGLRFSATLTLQAF